MAERSLNQVQLIGRLGRDAETAYTAGGTAIVKFSIATSYRYKAKSGDWKDETEWHNILYWSGEKVAPYLIKGTKVFIQGRLKTSNWEKDGVKHYKTEVVVGELMLLGDSRGGGREESDAAEPMASAPRSQRPQGGAPYEGEDLDVPF